jgi:simple sugar transport system ATP-binding protein
VKDGKIYASVALQFQQDMVQSFDTLTKLMALIRRMAHQGIAIVLVTHNLPLCFEVADRIVVLNRGAKVADIATDQAETDHVVGWITGGRAASLPT